MGIALASPVVFRNLGKDIAKTGEIVTNKMISEVQKAAKDRFNEIEIEVKKLQTSEQENLNMDIEKIKAEADLKMEELRNTLEDQSLVSQTQNTHQKDELQELRPFTFLSEPRYRELKTRWGQVFPCRYGC